MQKITYHIKPHNQLETEKNKLENVLNNNLTKKRERLQQELREVSVEEQNEKLSGFRWAQ